MSDKLSIDPATLHGYQGHSCNCYMKKIHKYNNSAITLLKAHKI